MHWTSVTYGQNQNEVLNPTYSKLNNSIPSFTTRRQLLKQLGKPTKVEKANFECALTVEQEEEKVQNVYYYRKTAFFIYDQKADLMEIDFKSGKFIYKTPKITLSNKTTFEEKKVYPQAADIALKENHGKTIRISPCSECDDKCCYIWKEENSYTWNFGTRVRKSTTGNTMFKLCPDKVVIEVF